MSLVTDIYSSYSKSYTGSTTGLSPARKKELTEKIHSAVSEYAKNSERAVARPEITENTETSALNDAGKVRPSGKTIGNVSLSKEANDYLESLKKKYSNLDFIVVSKDQKQAAQANAASYGNKNKTVVLIDEEKIERMATDEDFRKKYEGIIESSTKKLQAFGQQLSAGGLSGLVKGFGMNVSGNANTNDGGNSSFFAVVDESLSLQKQRIEKKAAEKKAEKKADDKKAKEKLKEERLEKKKETQERLKGEKPEDPADETEDSFDWKKGLYISSESPEALMRALSDYGYKAAEGRVFSKVELTVGKTVDYSG